MNGWKNWETWVVWTHSGNPADAREIKEHLEEYLERIDGGGIISEIVTAFYAEVDWPALTAGDDDDDEDNDTKWYK